MIDDYRNTKYCPSLDNIVSAKKAVEGLVKKDHPRAEDIHAYISKNDDKYKIEFMKAYNCKCAYCGVSIDLIPADAFEIDHFLYQENKDLFPSKKCAGYIENLILSCHGCNHKKKDFLISKEVFEKLYPDGDIIKKVFYRDDLFYIRIEENEKSNKNIVEFYNLLKLGAEEKRLDYLIMSLIGMQKKHKDKLFLCAKIGEILNILRPKRNIESV